MRTWITVLAFFMCLLAGITLYYSILKDFLTDIQFVA
ncbi:hypothetical protein electrica_02409 [Klebsiella electrica]|nr:hypothetical protein electrica_02409 [Klebsiella electrica]